MQPEKLLETEFIRMVIKIKMINSNILVSIHDTNAVTGGQTIAEKKKLTKVPTNE